MPAPTVIQLSDEQRREYRRLIHNGKTPVRLKQRLRIVLLAAEGLTNSEISVHVPLNPMTIGVWRNRFAEEGFDGIAKHRPRSTNISGSRDDSYDKLRQKIIETTLNEEPEGATYWSTRALARMLGTNSMFVSRVLRENGLKPHLTKYFTVHDAAYFEEKTLDVAGLFLSPMDNAVVISVDEKTSIQALDQTQPGLPTKKGRVGAVTNDYKRHGTDIILAAHVVATVELTDESKKRYPHPEFLSFLKTVEKQTPKGVQLHVLVEHGATHKHEQVRDWLRGNGRWTLHFMPTIPSWLTVVQRYFSLITEKSIKRGMFCSVAELERKLLVVISKPDEAPVPFVWTKSIETILE